MAKMNGRPAGVWRGAIDDAFGKQRPSHKTRESGVHAFQALEVKKGGLAPSGQVGVDQRYSTGKALSRLQKNRRKSECFSPSGEQQSPFFLSKQSFTAVDGRDFCCPCAVRGGVDGRQGMA